MFTTLVEIAQTLLFSYQIENSICECEKFLLIFKWYELVLVFEEYSVDLAMLQLFNDIPKEYRILQYFIHFLDLARVANFIVQFLQI